MTEAAPPPHLSLLMAVARNGVIGHQGQLPWRLPEDMAFFRRTTTGHAVVMGRRTWDSLPARFRPLPQRRNIVVTRNTAWSAPGAEAVPSLQAALQLAAGAPRLFVIGGAELYAAALPLADELLLTEIDADIEGDTHLPDFDRQAFVEVQRERHQAAAPNDFGFAFVTYRKR
ncbi:dihydrofolate reductase [Burkholderiales bacterium JOSHI_001]|nr:dihydrofolate reductase [Burkholderiales bacterium JOSHI_001]